MNRVKKIFEIMNYNKASLIRFEFVFKLLSFFIFTPIFLKSFTSIMKITGYQYITIENVSSFLLNPFTIVMLLILILLMTFYTMIDITTIIILLDGSYQKKKIKALDAFRISLRKCKSICKIRNIPLAFLVLFLIPFLNIGLTSSFITTIKIPEFILDFIIKNPFLLSLLIVLFLFFVFLLFRWIYSLHYFVLEDVSFKEARKKSKILSHKNLLKDIFTFIVVQISIALFYLLYIIIGILLILLLNQIFKKWILLKSVSSTIIWIFLALSFIFISLLSTSISYASISVLFYLHKMKKKEKIKSIHFEVHPESYQQTKKIKKWIVGLGILSIILGSFFTYGLYKGKYNLKIEYVRTMEVTAHRGASVHYPENTMSAFKGAKKMGADWIELDVQQTKDGKIFVSHDTNLYRVTGVNKDVISMNYNEIKELDAGSFFDKKYKNERIPLLEDVISWAKFNHMKLNIELKPTGKEKNFEKTVIDIIKANHYEDDCVITSQVYSVLEHIKKYDKNIETVYVMSLAIGNIISLDKADHFSVEASNVNSALVNKIHKEGKELYVWTVNTKENIKKMIDYNVDNIITDNITLAKQTITESKTSNLINEYIKFIENLL